MTLSSHPDQGIARAPLLFILGPVFLSLVLADRGLAAAPSGAVSFLVCLGALLVFSGARPPRFLHYVLLTAMLAFLLSFVSVARIQSFTPLRGAVTDGGEVILERSWGAKRAVVVEGEKGRFLLKISPDKTAPEGQSIFFTGEPASFTRSATSSFREDLYWRARGVRAEVVPARLSLKRAQLPGLPSFRTALRKKILLSLPPMTRGYLLAALLGASDPALAGDHREWGTAHLLAVSGFHVGLAAALAWKLLSLALFRRVLSYRARVSAASLLVWGYALLAGGAPSAVRAALMVQAVLLGRLMGRRGRPLNAVAMAALALLLWRPEWYADLGWRLSVTAALLLAALTELGGGWRAALAAPLLVWLATYPLTAEAFGAVPLSGIIVNMAALPVFAFLYPLAVAASLPALLGIPGGYYAAGAAEGLFVLWGRIADGLAALLPWSAPWSEGALFLGASAFSVVLSLGVFPPGIRSLGAVILLTSAAVLLF